MSEQYSAVDLGEAPLIKKPRWQKLRSAAIFIGITGAAAAFGSMLVHFRNDGERQLKEEKAALTRTFAVDGLAFLDADWTDNNHVKRAILNLGGCTIGDVTFDAQKQDGKIIDTSNYVIYGLLDGETHIEEYGSPTRRKREVTTGTPLEFPFDNIEELKSTFGENPCRTIALDTDFPAAGAGK